MNRDNVGTPRPDSSALAALNSIRAQNSQQPSFRAHFSFQRKQSDSQDPELQKAWFRGMKNVLEEVDQALRCIPTASKLYFLDVGCCPGGFSSYILSKNLRSKGMGISLPVTSGGHEFLLEEDLRSRLYLHQADLTKYPLGLNVYHQQPFPVHTNTRPFDLILLDGHPLRTSPSIPGDNYNNQKKGAILLVSQLIIGLQSISLSGTVIMKLSKPERVTTAKVLYMFDMLSLQLASWKPVCMHATRDTFYIVAKGIGHGKMGCKIEEWIHGLKILWEELMLGSRERGLEKRDMDFIVSERELGTVYSERLEQLSRHIWLVQETSISGWKLAEGL